MPSTGTDAASARSMKASSAASHGSVSSYAVSSDPRTTVAAKSGSAGSGSPACSATVWMRSDRVAAQSASSPAGAWRPCSTTSSRPEPPIFTTISDYTMSWYRPTGSQRDVAVVTTALRRIRDGLDDRFPGLGRLDDLVDHAQRLRPVQATGLPLVL